MTFILAVAGYLVVLWLMLRDCRRWPSSRPGRPDHDQVDLSLREAAEFTAIAARYRSSAAAEPKPGRRS